MRAKKGSKVVRLKKGSRVEVFRTSKCIPAGFWRPAQIVDGNGRTYTVRYDTMASAQHQHNASDLEKVPRKAIRPCPPVKEKPVKWALDDVVEVYVHGSWKVGKVVGVAYGNNFYFVTLMGHSRELAVRTSSLRRQRLWQHNKWVLTKKDCAVKGTNKQKNGGQLCGGAPNEVELAHGNGDGDGDGNGKVMVGEKCGYNNACRNESSVSSTGSCSTSARPHHSSPFFSYCEEEEEDEDAVSSSVPVKQMEMEIRSPWGNKENGGKMEMEAHKLALDAYRTTMVALHAKGFISWEQEAILSDLRVSLNISIDEHKSVLMSLSSLLPSSPAALIFP